MAETKAKKTEYKLNRDWLVQVRTIRGTTNLVEPYDADAMIEAWEVYTLWTTPSKLFTEKEEAYKASLSAPVPTSKIAEVADDEEVVKKKK